MRLDTVFVIPLETQYDRNVNFIHCIFKTSKSQKCGTVNTINELNYVHAFFL